MPVHNAEIANKLKEVADLLKIQDANAFRVRAYRNAARIIERLSQRATDMDEEDLTAIEVSVMT